MVQSIRSNGGRGPNVRLCAQDGREEEGEDGCSLFVLSVYHRQFLATTDSDSTESVSILGFDWQ
jgi:hypothetical protein